MYIWENIVPFPILLHFDWNCTIFPIRYFTIFHVIIQFIFPENASFFPLVRKYFLEFVIRLEISDFHEKCLITTLINVKSRNYYLFSCVGYCYFFTRRIRRFPFHKILYFYFSIIKIVNILKKKSIKHYIFSSYLHIFLS